MDRQIAIIFGVFALIFVGFIAVIIKDTREENRREYQLVCKTGTGEPVFVSSWGKRIYSNDWEWYTPDGKYIQSPETLCRKVYRYKDVANQ